MMSLNICTDFNKLPYVTDGGDCGTDSMIADAITITRILQNTSFSTKVTVEALQNILDQLMTALKTRGVAAINA